MNRKCLLMLLCPLLLASCTQQEISQSISSSNNSIVLEMPGIAKEFVELVNSIQLNDDFSFLVNEAFDLYDKIDNQTWNQFPEVQEAYYKLIQLEEVYSKYSRLNNMANDFMAKVDAIPYFLTISDERYIIAAENAYEKLGEAINIIGVAEAYEKLLKIRENFNLLHSESIKLELENEINDFLGLIGKLPSIDLLTLNDQENLNKATLASESLSEKAKEDQRVIEALRLLESLNKRYEELVEHPEYGDEIIIERFIHSVDSLNTISIDDGEKLLKAKEDYRLLTAIGKNKEEVIIAYKKLENLLDQYFKIYIEINGSKEDDSMENIAEESIKDFVNLIQLIKEEITTNDSETIVKAENKYDLLSINAKNDQRVQDAYLTLKSARQKLNTYLDKEIPFKANLLFSGDTIPHIVLQDATLYSEVKSFFGVNSTNDLKGKASMYLYVYEDFTTEEYVAKINVSDFLYNNSNIITGNSIVENLEKQSAFDKNLVSNKFSFGLQIEDRTGLYKESVMKRSQVSQKIYTFENIYKENGEDELILIHNSQEFIDIKNNLNGDYALANDIDLTGIEWKNLGVFLGTLDGNGHSIKNLSSTQGLDSQFGIFLEIKANAIVKNLVLEGEVENSGAWAGSIAVRNYGLIENCLIDLNISASGNIGGIVCENQNGGIINNCVVLSKINGDIMDGGISVGQYGTVNNTYFIGENISNGKAVGNNNTLSNFSKTVNELKEASLYTVFDKKIWCFINGYYPTLVRY